MMPAMTEAELEKCIAPVAISWLGTPWCANSTVKGRRGGVACHHLPRAILIEAGLLSADFPLMSGDPNATRHSRQSQIKPWLDARPELFPLTAGKDLLQPGDVIGLRIYHCCDHLALMVTRKKFIHVLMHKRATIDTMLDPTWSTRLEAAWRLNRKAP